MKRLTVILAGALGLQLVVALALSLSGSNHAAFKAQGPLLAFDADKIDQLSIDESSANSVTLVKRDGKWILPGSSDFPANGAKVNTLFRELAQLKKGWPIATTAEAAQRFKVADGIHERRIELKSGGKLVGELLLGTSPAFRQVHARVSGDNKVYNVAFANYEAGARTEDWMNRDFLNIPQDKITSISVGDVTLERKDGKFTMPGLAEGEKLNESEAQRLASAVARPSFDAIDGKGKDALAKLNEPDIQVTIKQGDGGTVTYKYKKEASGGAYLFASSAHDYVFKVAETSIDAIVKAKREKLVEAKKKEGEDAQVSTKHEQQPNASGG